MSYKKVLVIPSIREECLANFFEAWKSKGDWDEIVIVEDNPEKTFSTVGLDCLHISWKEINEFLDDNSWIISKRDSAIRCVGFWLAYKELKADYILTLDDDCYPYKFHGPIFQAHIDAMNSHPKWVRSIRKTRTRGLPYKNLGKLESVVANMGLWTNIPDFDAPHSLVRPYPGNFHPEVSGSRLISQGQYTPICGMNFCFKREVAPLAYFPLMGLDQPYSRFDDIWFGVIFKKIIDHLGLSLSVGEPFVEHQKASNVFTNLKKEAPGIERNESFWEIIDSIKLMNNGPITCMKQIADHLRGEKDEYIKKLGLAIGVWSTLFE